MAEKDKVTFVSTRESELTVVVKPSRYINDNFGVRQYVPGKSAQFHNHFLETNDKDIIKALREHRHNGVFFTEKEGEKAPEKSKETAKEIEEGVKAAASTDKGKGDSKD